jgi:TonB-linked SusC/RagA family outer membrane protein
MRLRWSVSVACLVVTASLSGQDSSPVLLRQVALHLNRVSLDMALGAVEQAASLRLLYDPKAMPSRVVSLDTARITAGDALKYMLRGVRVRVLVRDGNEVLIVPAPPEPQTGTVTGRVTAARAGTPVIDATVEATNGNGGIRRTSSAADGRYTLRELVPGTYSVSVRAFGFAAATQATIVAADSTSRVDFALEQAPAVLDRVVTTATGDQRIRALGNNIATIAVADSVVGRAPIATLSDVLNARASGVQVFVNGGLTGASPTINIRGQNSANLSNQPLLVIDGVRVDNSAADDNGIRSRQIGFSDGAISGRFDDLIPEEIENIEIVKGPSAATLYGTDAANGVIVVTTKRGGSGRPRWTIHGETGMLTLDRDKFRENFTAWGHVPGDPSSIIQGCTLALIGAGGCVQDSVTHYTPMRDPAFTPIGTGHEDNYGVQVSGGGTETRYFVSGTMQNEVGYLKMPQADLRALRVERGSIGVHSSDLHPNGVDKGSGRANVTTALGPTADLTAAVGVMDQSSRIPAALSFLSAVGGPGYAGPPFDGWAFGPRPGQYFAIRNQENITHVTGSVLPTWRPWSWLTTRASLGLDYSVTSLDHLERNGEGLRDNAGYRELDRTTSGNYTADVSATATVDPASWLDSRTSAGAQYTHRAHILNQSIGQELPPAGQTVTGAGIQTSGESTDESIIAGVYVEETLSRAGRLFLTGGLRVDGANTFGSQFESAVYPKASLSWSIAQERFFPHIAGLSGLRLRAAYGSSGVQPPSAAAIEQENLVSAFVDGAPTTGTNFIQLANPNLKPERQRELETGADLDLWNNRIHIEGTYYNKRSSDALIEQQTPASVAGGIFQWVNLGTVRNIGFEWLVRGQMIDSRVFDWDVTYNGSVNHNRLVSLGSGSVTPEQAAGAGFPQSVLGAPLGSYWDRRVTSVVSHDGIVEPEDITISGPTFVGPSYPTTQMTVSTGVGLFHQLRVSVQFDYRGGNTILDYPLEGACGVGGCPDAFRPGTPIIKQAYAVVAQNIGTFDLSRWGYYENGAFTRLRELAITYDLPASYARALHARSASLLLAGRNLALWTHYRGVDPEVQALLNAGSATPVPAAFVDLSGIPPATYWVARLTLGF